MQKDQTTVEPPYKIIAKALDHGKVIPFIGAAASTCHRPLNEEYEKGKNFFPLGSELAEVLAIEASFPDQKSMHDLALVASFYEHVNGDRHMLRSFLREVFDIECAPGPVHNLLARIQRPLLIVTTNYDDMLEQAFTKAKRSFHLVVSKGGIGATVDVQQHNAEKSQDEDASFETVDARRLREALEPLDWPIIFKMHGSFDRIDEDRDTFLITEQDYVDALGHGERSVPSYFKTLMRSRNLLFLGYTLRDWNVRVLVRKIQMACGATNQRRDWPHRFWAVIKEPGEVAGEIWQRQGLNIFDYDLKEFVDRLSPLVP